MFKTTSLAAALIATNALAAAADTPMAFDVAEDHTRFVFAPAPVHDNGMPAHGNPFVTQGYIYPAGTLAGNVAGAREDGSPVFPDKVLGTWTCDGWFVGEGGNTERGVWLVSRQIFDFGDGNTIVTQGTELADVGVENPRPITGASGDLAGQDGVVGQTLLGFSEFFAVNATFRIVVNEDHASLHILGDAPSPK
ncbi:hypothetical protein CLV78_107138 [Aliiruegeria haliotis]|uniref:Las17-binding protein actin regulator n=1 Tax=Aliiruegeria haliotis TaxID=1280846 RepID=A0A2T0RLZ6_9RHOB|nr:hypothetical protein [Aliiruegeria haliotis]PRY22214.1 hypothetical protein CLV78_107138 [Aliiruegeria haliotis]